MLFLPNEIVIFARFCSVQENIGCVGWELSDEDYQTLSSLRQHRYFTGTLAMHEEGPWSKYEELWDEKDVSEPL